MTTFKCHSRSLCGLNHPPYSPDLAPYAFFLFPKLKLVFMGHSMTYDDTINAVGETSPLSHLTCHCAQTSQVYRGQ